jgi:prepilin-type N-terminal cleavage/methylation domain-containing protein
MEYFTMEQYETPKKVREQGFTLIELSIVLVIIGLIVGGILVGQDLIKAAQLRATITQLERYDAAVNTFRTKYNGLPGDLLNCTNFFAAASCDTNTATAGNNKIDDFAGTAAGPILLSGEVAAFFRHLYLASEIGDPITDTTSISAEAATVFGSAFPAAKNGSGNYIIAYTGGSALTYPGMAGVNLYRITGIASVSAAAVPTFVNALSPLEAFNIDSKKDDGLMNSGIVQGTDMVAGANFNVAADAATAFGSSGATTCVGAVSNAGYNTVAFPTNKVCQLVIRTSF